MMMSASYRLRDTVRRNAAGLMLGSLLALLTVAIQLGLPFIVRYLIDALTAGLLTRRELLYGICLYAVCIPPAAVISYWMRRLPLRAAHRIEYTVRRDLFVRLSGQDPSFFQRYRIGDLMTRIGPDLAVVRDTIGHGVMHGARAFAALALAYTVLFRMQPLLAAVLLALMLGMILSFGLLLATIRRRHTAMQEQTSNLGHTVEETFSGIRTLKGFALEELRRQRFAGENRGLRRRAMLLSLISETIWPLFAFWFSLQLVVTLVYGGRLVMRGELSLGDLVLINQYLLFMQWPVLSLGWIGSLLQRSRTSWQRLKTLFETPTRIADGASTDFSITHLRGDIAFQAVRLRLGGKTVLDGIDLTIPAGTTLGITGPTGAGKSLLVALVPRLCDPDEGRVCIDGRALPEIPLAVLRRHIGFAPQETMLFSDTLAHNLALGLDQPAASAERVRAAAQAACLTEDIQRFPQGIETLVGERGVTLSGGQRQRAALGRAIARDPAILILDDALASVDTQTEAAILENLAPLTRQRTTLLISHRLAALYRADHIIVLVQGRIAEQGTHVQLLAQGGYYAETYRLQQIEADLSETNGGAAHV